MARKKRIWYPSAIYHVMSRGNRRAPIFTDGVWDTTYDSAKRGAYIYNGVEYFVAGGEITHNCVNGVVVD